MNKQQLEFEVAFELVAMAANVLERHYDDDDMDAALQALFATAFEIVCKRQLRPIEELFK